MTKPAIVAVMVVLMGLSVKLSMADNRNIRYNVPTKPDINYTVLDNLDISSSKNGIIPIPDKLGKTLNALFSKYTKVTAPNGKPIHIFAQKNVSDMQITRAREILSFHLDSHPGSKYSKDKSLVANHMAEVRATLIFTETEAHARAMYGILEKTDLNFQDLYATEAPVEGDFEYLNNKSRSKKRSFFRDACYEEIFHLVHDKGVKTAFPAYHNDIVNAMNVSVKKGQYKYGPTPLAEEYIITGFDIYFGLWEHNPQGNGYSFGDEYPYHTKSEMKKGDPALYTLVEMWWPDKLTYNACISPDFSGTFSTVFRKDLAYTLKSRYLVNITLTGSRNSGILGNRFDNRLIGNSGDNNITGGSGNDEIDGAEGIDTAVFTGTAEEYRIERYNQRTVVTDTKRNRDGTDYLKNIEFIQFIDSKIKIGD